MFTQICYMFRVFCNSFLTLGSSRRGNRFNPVFAVISCLVILLTVPAAAVTFTNVTVDANVFYVQLGGGIPGSIAWPLYSMTGGAAAGDYDNDGWVDLFVTRIDDSDILFRNKGNDPCGVHDGFEDVSTAAGFTDVLYSNGCAWGDIDNDGDLDLYLTTVGGDYRFFLYINDGNGVFTEDAVARGADVNGPELHFGFSAAFGDYDRDSYLDLHVTEWIRIPEDVPEGTAVNTRLLHNTGRSNPGHFTDVTNAAGVNYDGFPDSTEMWDGSFAFLPRFVDFDRDNWPDLLVIGDFTHSRLFWNNADGTFLDGTVAAGVNLGTSEMGAAIGDFDLDGDLDLFVTDIAGGGTDNRLYRYDGNRVFTDVAQELDVNDGGWGWGCAFIDYDNDGDPDITMTNGISIYAPSDYSKLWRNDGVDSNGVHNGFTDVGIASGIVDNGVSTGLLTFDYDRDGDVDIFIVGNHTNPPILYRNDGGNANDYLRIETIGTFSNSQGIGAFITVTPDITEPNDVLVWEINTGSNYLGQDETTAHFGLGPSAGTVDLVNIKWPSGQIQEFTDVAPNTTLIATEPMPDCPVGDVDGDCKVTMVDLALVCGTWLECGAVCD